MPRSPISLIRLAIGALFVAACSPSARALTIIDHFVAAGEELAGIGLAGDAPQQFNGAGSLPSVFRAAANHWERAIRDDFTVTVNYGWFATAPITPIAFHQGVAEAGTPERQIEGSIAFSNDGLLPFYLDPSPADNFEFGPLVVAQSDFGAGPINILRELAPVDAAAVGSIDLLSTAIHELGHALGLVGWPFYNDEIADGAINVVIAGFEGTTIPVMGTHLTVNGPAMSGFARPLGSRRLITDLDVLAVSQVSQFSQFLTPPGSDFNGDWQVDSSDLVNWIAALDGGTKADANLDGASDGADFMLWQQQFGWTAPKTSTTVPEPALLGVVIGLAPLGYACRERRTRWPK
ncbi:hypothetical protein [Lacipirellula limnantheis]|uniref:PEP-CTERM protein-sorting domain-containing protein n=1 Tax=Lacipirellula limnantheis TaxID=2528024 RepID=A0A517U5D1_9BACT|nr:hypothetical protein [Lacipirellula limnantheis]QDT75813.1 hypothetical protein I41_50560 [Lacipirellula limnantheis]